ATDDLLISASIQGNAASNLTVSGQAAANNGRLILTGNNTYGGTTTINNFETVLRGGGQLASTTSITINPVAPVNTPPGATLPLDNSGTNNNNRINDAATLTMTSGTPGAPSIFNYIGNAAGSTETFAGTTLTAGGYSIFRSTTTAGGAVSVTSSSLTRGAGA